MALTTIIFDLDDTLYPRGTGPLREVGRRIQQWLSERLDLNPAEAAAMRQRYAEHYGTTLGGLVAEHEVDVGEYLSFVHDLPVDQYVQSSPALAAMLRRIPLRKVIYTNATTEYSWRVMKALGVADCFEHVVGIEEVGLRNKPYPDAFECALELLGAHGRESIMVEDTARNLVPAKALGARTVLIDGEPTEYVDYVVGSVLEVEQVVERLLIA
jgi:putative hydrolase of the HAD superfamily